MPRIEVVFYGEPEGGCPLLDWLDRLQEKARDKCIVRIERLAELGHELRRPEADLLCDGIHELRATHRGIHYRILYFFSGRVAVLAHGLVKERRVPEADIQRARERKNKYETNPHLYTFQTPIG